MKQYQRPPLYHKQLVAFYCPERTSVIEGSTKSGKTHAAMVWQLENGILFESFFKGIPPEGKRLWWVAPVYNQARIAYERMKLAIKRGGMTTKNNDSDKSITLPNGIVLEFKSGEKPDNLYGDDVYACVVDEASRMREESWFAIRSTLTATKGKVRLVGNVKGRSNWFYKLCRRAKNSKDLSMRYTCITSADSVRAGVLDREDVMEAKHMLPERVFKELYLCIPSDDGGNPFGLQHIAQCVKGRVEDETGLCGSRKPIVFGIDLAKSYDYTVIYGLDMNGDTAYFRRFQKSWEHTYETILEATKGKPTLIDSTGVGDPIVERLQTISSNFTGFKFTLPSKQQLMEGLEYAIQKKMLTIPAGVVQDELEQFEYEYIRGGVRYNAPEGFHDDAVCALALANKLLPKAQSVSKIGISKKQTAQAMEVIRTRDEELW